MMFNTAVGLVRPPRPRRADRSRSGGCRSPAHPARRVDSIEHATARPRIDKFLFRDRHEGVTPGRMGLKSRVFRAAAVECSGADTRRRATCSARPVLALPACRRRPFGHATGLESTGGPERRMAVHGRCLSLLGPGCLPRERRHGLSRPGCGRRWRMCCGIHAGRFAGLLATSDGDGGKRANSAATVAAFIWRVRRPLAPRWGAWRTLGH